MSEVFFETDSNSGSPDTPRWHAWRRAGIGGSDAHVIAADAGLIKKLPWMKSLYHLWKVKTGMVDDEIKYTPAMERGRKNEVKARILFEKKTGISVSPAFFEMCTYSFIRASIDGITPDRNVIVEIKVPSAKVHDAAKSGSVIEYYRPQIVHQALTVWGLPDGWKDQVVYFVSFHPETSDLAIVEVKAKVMRSFAEKLFYAETEFWHRVVSRTPPCSKEWRDAAAAYISAHEELERAKLLLEEARQRLISFMDGVDRMEGAGVSVTRSYRKGNVDYISAIRALLPDKTEQELKAHCEKFRKESTEVLTVRVLRDNMF